MMHRRIGIKSYAILFIIIFCIGCTISITESTLKNSSPSPLDISNRSEIVVEAWNAEPLKLDDGYELALKSVDIDGNKVYQELYKDGVVVDSKVIIPANEANGTFVYSRPGRPPNIKVHIKNVFRGAEIDLLTLDNIWQTSENDPNRILIENNQSFVIASGPNLKLEEDYLLTFKSADIDGNKAFMELSKEGKIVENQVILAANEIDDTLAYSKPETDQKILVHFKNAYRGPDHDLVTIDKIFQTSELNPSHILIDNSTSLIVTSGNDLKFEEGYELAVKAIDIDGNRVYVELLKDQFVVDSKIILAENDIDDTYSYSDPLTGKEIVVHFKNSLRGADHDLATIDGILQ